MRIGLNLLHAVPDIGGGWNYIQNLLAALGREDRTNTYVAFANAASASLVPRQPNFTVVRVPLRPGARGPRVLFEHTALQALVLYHRLDCLHWFANGDGIINAAPAVVTVYDLQPFVDKVALTPRKRAFLQARMRSAAQRAAVLLPMSDTTADLLASMLGADPARMIVVPPVIEPEFQPASDQTVAACRARHRLPAQFWLYVAHLYPHKNHERLLQAYRQVRANDPATWPLVLRGDAQPESFDLPRRIADLGLEGHVHLLPRLDRAELPALYTAASALVFPSTYEGAGIPLLEAQACGCVVAASDIRAAREFAADAAKFFDPLDPVAIERAMLEVQANPMWRDDARRRGLEHAARYRGPLAVERLLDAYARVGGTVRPTASPLPHAGSPADTGRR
jgi:alpha-1,3-rhamnosyl/mannosyltransferase